MTIKERNKIIRSAKKVECRFCDGGEKMCQTRPCWGTVNDFKRIIDAGYATSLMIDYYSHESINNGKKIYFLSGASRGNECSKADWNPIGTCKFFVNHKCIIHQIKPTMGAVTCCKEKTSQELTHACLLTWNTRTGEKLINDWKKMVNYVEVEDDREFNLSALALLLSLIHI